MRNCRSSMCGGYPSACWLVRLEFLPARLPARLEYPPGISAASVYLWFYDRPPLKITTKHADFKNSVEIAVYG